MYSSSLNLDSDIYSAMLKLKQCFVSVRYCAFFLFVLHIGSVSYI